MFLFAALLVASPGLARLFNGQVNFGPNLRTGNFDIEIIDPDGIGDYRVIQGRAAAGPVEVPWTGAGDCPGRVRFALPGRAGPHLNHDHMLDYHDCQTPPQRETWILQGGVPFAAGATREATRVIFAVPLEERTDSLGIWLPIIAVLLALLVACSIVILIRLRRLNARNADSD